MLKKGEVKIIHKMIKEGLSKSAIAHKTDKEYQIWEEGYQPKHIQTDAMMVSKIQYIHENPVKRGYVDEAVHWRYSSARDYDGEQGLIAIERFW